MKKVLLSLFVFAVAFVALFSLTKNYVIAEEPTSGTCGDNLTWNYDSGTETLTISGNGNMIDYYIYKGENGRIIGRLNNRPWESFRNSIMTVILDDGVKTIGSGAFYGCSELIDISIPSNITNLGERAFCNCSSLVNIEIPDSVTNIGKCAFYNCTSLKSLKIGSGFAGELYRGSYTLKYPFNDYELDTSCDDVFFNCISLEELIVSENNIKYHSSGNCLIETGSYTLVLGCNKSVIPNDGSVKNIGPYAFCNFSGLSSIIIPDNILNIEMGAFYYCSGLTEIIIPDNVTTIGSMSFLGCTELKNVYIGKNTSDISGNPFISCPELENIVVSSDNSKYYSFKNCLINKNNKKLIAGCMNSIIPSNGVDTISNSAFYGCSNLKKITIPFSVSTIESRAFNYTGLQIVYYCGSSSAWKNVGGEGKGALSNITLYYHTSHTYIPSVTTPATCTENGVKTFSCACGDSYTEEILAAHQPELITIQPTCIDNGATYTQCSTCKELLSEITETPSLGHDIIYHDGIVSTCNEHGHTAYETCSRCDYTTFEELPLANHTPDEAIYENEIPSSCIKSGNYDSVVYCIVCGEELSRETISLPLASHTESAAVKENEIVPTHTAYGSYDSVVYCSICGEELNREHIETEPLGHNYYKTVTAPTCTESGYTTYTCSCGDSYTANRVAPLGHDTIHYTGKASTCIVKGYKSYDTCSRCDYTTYEELPLGEHSSSKAIAENEKPATCTENGHYDSVIYCSVCGEEMSRETFVTNPLGHDPVHHNGKVSTCLEHGYNEYDTCSRCDYTTFEELPLGDHSPAPFVVENSTESDCKNAGKYDEVVYCSVCEAELSREHKYKELAEHVSLEAIKENEISATCTEGGSYDSIIYCGVCGVELSKEKVAIPVLGHSFTKYIYNNDATAKKDGTETAKCDRCNATDTRVKAGTKLKPGTSDKPGTDNSKPDISKVKISAPTGKKQINWKYRPHLVATATNLPKGYGVAWFEGKTKVSVGGDFTAKEGFTSTHTYTAKIVDENGNAVTSSQEKKVTIEVKDDFFTKIISFFSRLFGSDVVNI